MKHEEVPPHRNAGQHFSVQILFANCDLQCTGCEFKRLHVLTCCIHEPTPVCQSHAFWTSWCPEPGSFEFSRKHFIQFVHRGNGAIDLAHSIQHIRHNNLI